MRIFYTESDIEDLAASGVKQLEVGPSVGLTDVARERAEELGITLVTPGSAPVSKPAAPSSVSKSGALPLRPKGCQHGPLIAQASQTENTHRIEKTRRGEAVVDQLVEAVSALKKRGG